MFHIEMEATNLCNTRCLHCPHEVMRRPLGKMDWATYETVIGKVRQHGKGGAYGGAYSVTFTGMGEPLLNPILYDFIRFVSREAETSFATNGSALTEANIRK